MNNTIFKQTWQQMHEQPLISIVSIVGTALSLFLIMLVVMITASDGGTVCTRKQQRQDAVCEICLHRVT
jgi:apolipoprotein N-acyltransferase